MIVSLKMWCERERCHMTELTGRDFLLGEKEQGKEGRRRGRPASGDMGSRTKRGRESWGWGGDQETSREAERQRERNTLTEAKRKWRWAGPYRRVVHLHR